MSLSNYWSARRGAADRTYVVFRDVATGRVPLQRGSSTCESTDEQRDENGSRSVFGEGGCNLI